MRIGALALWMTALACYDLRCRRLPNWLTLPGAAAILLFAGIGGRGWSALAGAAALASVYLLVHLVAPTSMGAGDVKLAIGLGALAGSFGADAWFLAALAGPLLTLAFAALRRERAVPHGPSMCLATAAAVALTALGQR